MPPAQFARFLLVGTWNTLFGYGCFAALTALLTPVVPYAYIAASLLANAIGITVAFLGYKWFVFRTKGNYLKEWARCLVVYSGSMLITAALLPVVVGAIRHFTSYRHEAPYIAGGLLTGVNVIVSFFGHKKFSFRAAA
jgi:putative flippase GtrA